MHIKKIILNKLSIPLIKPFITAVRKTECVCDLVIELHTNTGIVGYGSCASTPMITGDSIESITHAIDNIIAPKIIGIPLDSINEIINYIDNLTPKNTSTKAMLDMALYDIFAKVANLPLYRYLGGGFSNKIATVITISAKDVNEMLSDAHELIASGFNTLKLKAGLNPDTDLENIIRIRNEIPPQIKLIIDANQGWQVNQAIHIINHLEASNILFIEQPVKSSNLEGLTQIHHSVKKPIIADETCFSTYDVLDIVQNNRCDGINIKLMKSGGIYNANSIYHIASAAHLKVMVGCMLESPIGVNAMASFALSHKQIHYADLDPIALIKHNPVIGGIQLIDNHIVVSDTPGLGITTINDLEQTIVIN